MRQQFEPIEIITEDINENDISELLQRWEQANKLQKSIDAYIEFLKNTIKGYLKTREWDKYLDKKTKINVSISRQERQVIDKEMLKSILSEQQLAKVTKVSVFDKLLITTPEMRERLKKFVTQKRA